MLKRVRRIVSLYHVTSPPRQHSSVPRENPQPKISPKRENESIVSKHPVSPAMQETAPEAHFFLAPPRILR